MEQFLTEYFLENGFGWAVLGAMCAVGLGVCGSSTGVSIAASQSSGVLSERPDLFTPCIVRSALPGTKGFYGLISGIFIAMRSNIIQPLHMASHMPRIEGLCLCFTGIPAGTVFRNVAVQMGTACASSINLAVRRPDDFGRSLLFPARIETYSVT
jgi:V/A-type H+/Na+-transporting ATPase subunit K